MLQVYAGYRGVNIEIMQASTVYGLHGVIQCLGLRVLP